MLLLEDKMFLATQFCRSVRWGTPTPRLHTAALWHAGTILRDHRGHMPREAWLECCQVFLKFVDQLAGCSPDDERSTPAQELKVRAPLSGHSNSFPDV